MSTGYTSNQFQAFGASAYASIDVETKVKGATPHDLVLMLYDGIIDAIKRADIHLDKNNVAEKGKAISHAIRMINEGLRVSLDHQQGGEISANLDSLYDYMTRRLVSANAHNDKDALHEVIKLLEDLRSAWVAAKP